MNNDALGTEKKNQGKKDIKFWLLQTKLNCNIAQLNNIRITQASNLRLLKIESLKKFKLFK